MKRLFCCLLNVALVGASVLAPGAHVHAHEETQAHQGALFHTHVAHSAASPLHRHGFANADPDDDALFQNWLSATAISVPAAALPAVASATFVIPEAVAVEWHAIPFRPSAHDPPDRRSSAPRAPPL